MKKLSPATLLITVLLTVPALAVVPRFWEVRTYEDLVQGELDGLSITGEGELVLAPVFEELFDTGEPLVFSAVADADGNVYLGTGHEGRVFRVDPGGSGTLVADFDELDVLALELDSGGTLFAATSPDGRVYRVARDGEVEVFFDPDDLYIWDLKFDRNGDLLVATGEDGIIYRVDVDGSAQVFYDSDNTHMLTMVVDGNGDVIAGGSPRGYVYRVSEDGRPFVLYDSGMDEVRSIALSPDGEIYAAILGFDGGVGGASASGVPPGGGAATATITVNLSTQIQAAVVQDDASSPAMASGGLGGASGRGPGNGAGRTRILEILPGGAVTTIWQSNSEMVFSLLPSDGQIYFSSGTRGRIYALGASRQPTLLVESTEEQTTRLLRAAGRMLAASSNRGKLWAFDASGRIAGSYESSVRDTGAISAWGRLTWAGSGVGVSTRSGNTASPDATWSDWAAPATSGEIVSPPARFIQWRAVLDASASVSPVLSSVTLPYLQQNFRPDVSSLEVLQPGLALREQQSVSNPTAVERGGVSGRVVPLVPRPSSRTAVEAGAQALRWTATDENGDVLSYSVLYREENEADWKTLASDLSDSFYTIEPNTLPDGMYMIRLVASDDDSNPPDVALTGERTTRPFAIDRTPPTVNLSVLEDRGSEFLLEATATDLTSTLKQAEMSIDAGRWVSVFPVDGIIDSLVETFRFSAGPLGEGEHVISFRIYDQNENTGIGKTIVRIP